MGIILESFYINLFVLLSIPPLKNLKRIAKKIYLCKRTQLSASRRSSAHVSSLDDQRLLACDTLIAAASPNECDSVCNEPQVPANQGVFLKTLLDRENYIDPSNSPIPRAPKVLTNSSTNPGEREEIIKAETGKFPKIP